MRIKLKTSILIACSVAFGVASTFCLAQTTSQKGPLTADEQWYYGDTGYAGSLGSMRTERFVGDNAGALRKSEENFKKAMRDAIGSKYRTNVVAGYIATDPIYGNSGETTAFQILQNQRLIEQNAQIISLLQKIAAKK